MTCDLSVDAIEALLGSHQSGNANDGLVTEHAYLDLRSIGEGCSHGRHPLFDEEEIFDRVAGKFDLTFQLKLNRTQTETRDNLCTQRIQERVSKSANHRWSSFGRRENSPM